MLLLDLICIVIVFGTIALIMRSFLRWLDRRTMTKAKEKTRILFENLDAVTKTTENLATKDRIFAEAMIESGLDFGKIFNPETGNEIDLSIYLRKIKEEQNKPKPISVPNGFFSVQDYENIANEMIKVWNITDLTQLFNKDEEVQLFIQTYLRSQGIDRNVIAHGEFSFNSFYKVLSSQLEARRDEKHREKLRIETAMRVKDYRLKGTTFNPDYRIKPVKEMPTRSALDLGPIDFDG